MNKCHHMGRFTKAPEVRYTSGANPIAIARFTLAVDRRNKKEGEQSADFLNYVAFGKTAEYVEKYMDKGTKVVITSRVQTGSYKDSTGRTVYTTDFVVEDIEFAESKKAEGKAEQAEQKADEDGFMNIPEGIDEDLPFAQPTR